MRKNGFTLVELIVVMAISAVAGTLLITILVQSNGVFFQQNSKISQGVSVNDTIEEIRSATKQAASVASGYPTSSPQYVSNISTLVLGLPSFGSDGNAIENTYDYVVFTKDSQNPVILRKLVFPDIASFRKSENKVLITKLSLINFYYQDKNGTLVSPTSATQISFVINEIEKAGIANQQSSASAQVSLRNN